MPSAAEFQAKVTKNVTNMDRLDSIVNGGPGTEVSTDNGLVPSMAKAIKDFQDEAEESLGGLNDQATEAAAAAAASATAASVARDAAAGSAAAAAFSEDAALAAGNLYSTTAAGLAGTAEGGYFSVAQTGDVFATLYQNVSGSAVQRNQYPSKAVVDVKVSLPDIVQTYKLEAGYLNFNVFEQVETTRRARTLSTPAVSGTHVGTLVAGFGIEHRVSGSGANGPSNADVGLVVSSIKTSDAVGEMDGIYIVAQQRGDGSDVAGVLCDISRKGGTGFSCQWEGVTKDVDPGNGDIVAATRIQTGIRDTVTGIEAAFYGNAQIAHTKYGLLLSSNAGIFDDFISCFYGTTGLPCFNVGETGEVTVRKGGLLDGEANAQLVSEFYAATGGAGTGGGNTLGVVNEFRHYTTPTDWQTSEFRTRFSVDGESVAPTSPWYGLRGRAGATSSFVVGFGYGDAPTLEVRNTGHIRSALLPSLNYSNDAAAASGGVAVGELYHTAGTVKVRLT